MDKVTFWMLVIGAALIVASIEARASVQCVTRYDARGTAYTECRMPDGSRRVCITRYDGRGRPHTECR